MLERSTHVGAHRRGRVITIDWRRDWPGRDERQAAPRPVTPQVVDEWALRVERRLVDVLGVPGDGRQRHVTGPWTVEDLRDEVLRLRGDARINAYVVRLADSEPFVVIAPFEGRHPRKTFCRMGMRMVVGPVGGVVDAFVGAPVLSLLHPPADVRYAPFYIVGLSAARHAAASGQPGYVASQRRR